MVAACGHDADEITSAQLQTLVANPEPAAAVPPWENLELAETEAMARIIERFEQFGVLAVIGAGLLDGVNPCAFTTMIFFVSYLALVGRKGREILLVGAAFTLAVFLTYLAIGLGLAEVLRQIESLTLVSRVIYGITAVICLALAAIAYLILYNLMFVVPLVFVFTVTYFGTSSKQLTTLFQAHAGSVKLLTAVLFTVLGVWLGYLVIF